ncbi:MAG TPA: GNAT family N-acetyltransferase [Tepidisphaeraceae bacterium]|nr:GNAT family N-acetyltransferase [Tepidisphaeraceae bacterium]
MDAPDPQFTIRGMDAADVGRCFWVRTHTREQCSTLEGLTQAGISEDAVTRLLTSSHKGWVCEQDGQIVGFSMADGSNGEFWVVAVLPEYEGRGIGRQLIERGQQWLHDMGWQEIWLCTSPNTSTRAYKLYGLLGWRDCGVTDGQRIMRRHKEQRARQGQDDHTMQWTGPAFRGLVE